MKKGKLIVVYGVNNLGKTTQSKLLVKRLEAAGRKAKYLKYPVYDLKPSGRMLDEYLRKGNPYSLTPREAQLVYAFNRAQYEPMLIADLEQGINAIVEDYWATGVAWGIGAGVDKDFLLRINKEFLMEDLAFLFFGQRFSSGFERKHLHEKDNSLTEKVVQTHEELGKEFGWIKINANRSIEEISQEIFENVKAIL